MKFLEKPWGIYLFIFVTLNFILNVIRFLQGESVFGDPEFVCVIIWSAILAFFGMYTVVLSGPLNNTKIKKE